MSNPLLFIISATPQDEAETKTLVESLVKNPRWVIPGYTTVKPTGLVHEGVMTVRVETQEDAAMIRMAIPAERIVQVRFPSNGERFA